jgi:hypothetical protein
MEVTADKKEQAKAKRKALRELSKIAKMRMQADCEGMSVNEILIQEFYTDDENYIFKTFHDWRKEKKKVKKGATAFLIWGKPKDKSKKEETPKTETSEDEKDDFFPLCYLFSNAQVEDF